MEVMFKEDYEKLRARIEGIKLCLHELEKEAHECGYKFSAQLIRAAALSLESEQE